MNVMPEMPGMPHMSDIPEETTVSDVSPDDGAVSVYDNPIDEFPVLKAFQQYIDAEQEKARKRLLSLGVFFGFLMLVIIGVFVYLLTGANLRNQQLNDKLLDFAMREREHTALSAQPDNSAVEALAAKIEEMQKNFEEALRKSHEDNAKKERLAAEEVAAAQKSAMEKLRTQESEEIVRLKALLEAEKQKNIEERQRAEEERKRIREEELEAYRRKHYPEFYEKKEAAQEQNPADIQPVAQETEPEIDPIDQLLEELNNEIDEENAINYFEEDDAAGKPIKKTTKKTSSKAKPKSYAIPVEVKGSRGKWRIPND